MKKIYRTLITILSVLVLSLSVLSVKAEDLTDVSRKDVATPITVDASLSGFVTRLYVNILGRQPEPAGLKYWVNKISSGEKSVIWVSTYGFFHSKEYKNKKTTNSQFVNICYKTFLDRNAEPGGYNYWMKKLSSGMTRDEVLSGFAYSKEFSNIQAKFGIGKGVVKAVSVQTSVTSSSSTVSNSTAKAYSGKISIPRVGYTMALQVGSGSQWQKIVDNKETALFVENFLGKQMVADHAADGLKLMKSCKSGDSMTITLNGKTTHYIMTTIYKNAVNNGSGILVGNKYADEMSDGDLFMYCCKDRKSVV